MKEQTTVKTIGIGVLMHYSSIGFDITGARLELISFITEQKLLTGDQFYIEGMDGLFEIKTVEENTFGGLKLGGEAYTAIPIDINKKAPFRGASTL